MNDSVDMGAGMSDKSNNQITKPMKKIILVLTVSAFSIGAYAGGKECAAKGQAACCADKAKAGATCQDAKAACCEKSLAAKNSKKVRVVQSPKAAGQSDRAS